MASTLIANEIPGLGKLIEIPELNEVLQRLNEAVGITTAVDDLGGNALAVSGFQKLCRFHRDNPETCERCRQSDQSLLEQARSNRGYATQQCMNGLVDATAPIHVGGEHLANVFTGQALNEPPDLEAFRSQAKRFGFDEAEYLDAVRALPVVSAEQIKAITELTARVVGMLAENGLEQFKLSRVNEKLGQLYEEIETKVAERTASLSALKDSLQLSLAVSRQGAFDLDIPTGTVSVSPEYPRLLGYDPEEFETSFRNWTDHIHPDDLPRLMSAFKRALGTDEPVEMPYRRMKKNGDWVWINSIGKVVERDADGNPVRMTGVHADITERVQAEAKLEAYRQNLENLVEERTRELREAREKAEAASIAKSMFLANMSHEIRTPINAITGLTHLVGQGSLSEDQASKLEKIEASVNHLLSIINNILDISKIEAGKMVLEKSGFRLDEVFDYLQEMFSEEAEHKSIAFEIDVAGVPNELSGDITRLRQVLLNLVGNAIKFTEEGKVVLRVRVQEESHQGLLLRFEVRDTGIGIQSDKLAGLFELFTQEDASTTRKHGGTGLGLAITRRLASLMGGEAGAESELGEGSTFWFTALLDRGEESDIREPAAHQEKPDGLPDGCKGAHVLLVEDNIINQEVASELLRRAGLLVDVAENGRQAVSWIRDNECDLVLMDVQMPEMDGLEATRLIRSMSGKETLPILAMTANVFEEDRRQCLDSGMNDFVAKPMNVANLFGVLSRWLPDKSGSNVKEF